MSPIDDGIGANRIPHRRLVYLAPGGTIRVNLFQVVFFFPDRADYNAYLRTRICIPNGGEPKIARKRERKKKTSFPRENRVRERALLFPT